MSSHFYKPLGDSGPQLPANNYRAFLDNGPSWSRDANLNTIRRSEVHLQQCIGAGGFGKVYRATIYPAGRESYEAAVKIPHQSQSEDPYGLRSEALIFSMLDHTNILRMLGLIVEGANDQGIALEFCSGGALNQWLKQHKERLHLQQSIQWCLQIGKGMEYLHKRAPASFLHRDLKSSNILLLYSGATCPSKQVLKISDFGLARARREQQSHEEFTTAGTYAWMAPESIRSSNFSPASDVWSFGVLVWEILTGEAPYRGMEPLQVALAVAQRQLRLPVPESIPQILASVMRNCWEEEPNSRPEFDAIVVRLDCAQKELSVYDNQDSVNLQTTMRKQVCGMLEDLKEKAGELRTKEVELKEREMAVLRRHKDLEQREMDVVQREIILLLKEKEIDQRSSQPKEKKKDKHRKLGPIISRPRTFEHIVSVKPRDGGLQVVEPRAKTWGHRNGELAAAQIRQLSSSTSDMDKIGKSSTKHECLKNPLFDVARLFIGIGLSRDICEPLDKLPKTPSEISNSPTSPPTIRNVQNQVQPSPPSSPNLSALLPHASSVQNNTSPSNDRKNVPLPNQSIPNQFAARKSLQISASTPPNGTTMTRQRPRGRGHRRAPSEPIDKMDIARIAGQLESDNHIKRQEQMLSGTIMDGKNSARPRSAGPPTQRLSVGQSIGLNQQHQEPISPSLPQRNLDLLSNDNRAQSADHLSFRHPLDDPVFGDTRPSIL